MPDVKWYSASTPSTGVAVASGSGTTNRLMKFDASDNAADSFLADDGTLNSGTGKLAFTLSGISTASAAGAVLDAFDITAQTFVVTGSTNITTAAGFNLANIGIPTYSAASALTITNAAALYIAGAPAGGGAGPATITNAYSLWVDAGTARFDGLVALGSGAAAAIKNSAGDLQVRDAGDGGFAHLVALNLSRNNGSVLTFTTNASGTSLANNYPLLWSSTSSAEAAADLGLYRNAAGVLEINNASAGTYRDLIVRGVALGQSPAASNYLVITGSSGAGGTPTTTNLTDGSGVAIYTQQAHDAQATKFVIAYNLGGTVRYLVATLDGSTTTWSNSATRP